MLQLTPDSRSLKKLRKTGSRQSVSLSSWQCFIPRRKGTLGEAMLQGSIIGNMTSRGLAILLDQGKALDAMIL